MDPRAGVPSLEDIEEIPHGEEHYETISPIVRRTSSFFGPFDSVSVFTDTTVPSEVAAFEVEAYEKRKKLETDAKQKKNNIQYNLRVDRVVIVGGN